MSGYDYSKLKYIKTEGEKTTFDMGSDLSYFNTLIKNGGADPADFEEGELKRINDLEGSKKEMKLFSDGNPKPEDVVQVNPRIGYMMSALRSMAAKNPDAIKNMMELEMVQGIGKNGEPAMVPTGNAIVHFFAEKDGKKVPFDVKVPITRTPASNYDENTMVARWPDVMAKAYYASMLWRTGGKLPTSEEMEAFYGEGELPDINREKVHEEGAPTMDQNANPDIFMSAITPGIVKDAPNPISSTMNSKATVEEAINNLSFALLEAKDNKKTITLSAKGHTLCVDDVTIKDGKASVNVYDPLTKKSGIIAVEDLLKAENGIKVGDTTYEFEGLNVFSNNGNEMEKQTIPTKDFVKKFEKEKGINQPVAEEPKPEPVDENKPASMETCQNIIEHLEAFRDQLNATTTFTVKTSAELLNSYNRFVDMAKNMEMPFNPKDLFHSDEYKEFANEAIYYKENLKMKQPNATQMEKLTVVQEVNALSHAVQEKEFGAAGELTDDGSKMILATKVLNSLNKTYVKNSNGKDGRKPREFTQNNVRNLMKQEWFDLFVDHYLAVNSNTPEERKQAMKDLIAMPSDKFMGKMLDFAKKQESFKKQMKAWKKHQVREKELAKNRKKVAETLTPEEKEQYDKMNEKQQKEFNQKKLEEMTKKQQQEIQNQQNAFIL